MIFGRPVNLVIGAITAVLNAIVLALAAFGITLDGALVAAVNTAILAIIAAIANQPPTVQAGDTVRLATPPGQPNQTVVITPPEPITVPAPTTSQPAQDVTLDGQ